MNYKAIIFDNIGVILVEQHKNWSRQIAKHYHLSPAKIYQSYSRQKAWQLFKTGKISEDQFWRRGNQFTGLNLNIKVLKRLARQTRKPNVAIVALLKRLKGKYLLGLMTNESREWHVYSKQKNRFYQYFQIEIPSYKYKIAKPQKKIYRLLIKKLHQHGLKPDEAIYIDDYQNNLPPARRLGFNTILFKSVNNLVKDFKKRGILP